MGFDTARVAETEEIEKSRTGKDSAEDALIGEIGTTRLKPVRFLFRSAVVCCNLVCYGVVQCSILYWAGRDSAEAAVTGDIGATRLKPIRAYCIVLFCYEQCRAEPCDAVQYGYCIEPFAGKLYGGTLFGKVGTTQLKAQDGRAARARAHTHARTRVSFAYPNAHTK